MKTVFKIFLISLFLASCTSLKNSNSDVVAVVTSNEELNKYLGKLIMIKGEIKFSYCGYKYSGYFTVNDVVLSHNNLNDSAIGKVGFATGILETFEIKETDLDRNKGCAGTYYFLKSPQNKYRGVKVKLLTE